MLFYKIEARIILLLLDSYSSQNKRNVMEPQALRNIATYLDNNWGAIEASAAEQGRPPDEFVTRTVASSIQQEYTFGSLRLNSKTRVCEYGGRKKLLGSIPCTILKLLMINPETPVSWQEICLTTWGAATERERANLQSTISRLRQRTINGSGIGIKSAKGNWRLVKISE